MKFQGILFDLDNTLYDESSYCFSVFEKFCDTFRCYDKIEGIKRQVLASFFSIFLQQGIPRLVGLDVSL